MHGREGGTIDLDDEFARRSTENSGAFILGRNMFGPVRGPWLDNSWKGWWGDNSPYHAPTFVLTHYQREPLVMEGGTTFYLLPAESVRRWHSRRKPQAVKMSRSEAACQRYGST
jgi:dihydrofolate reductase